MMKNVRKCTLITETAMAPYRAYEPVKYALAGDQMVFAGDFKNTDPRTRPRVTCIATGRRLSIKAGTQLQPHMAVYRDGTRSSGPRRETARHINARGHLLYAVRSASQLTVEVPCAGAPDAHGHVRRCDVQISFLAARNWTEVVMETKLDSRRPDGRLQWHGRPVLLFELYATHAVDWLKARDLSRLDAPTVEVVAEPRLYDGASAWSAANPLPARRVIPEAMAPRCPEHTQAYRVRCVDLFGVADLPFFKLVDVSPLNGEPWRSVFRLDAIPNGPDCEILWTLRQDGRVVAEVLIVSWSSAKRLIEAAFEHAVSAIRRNHRAVVVATVQWVPYADLPVFSPAYLYDTTRWPLGKPPRRGRARK